MTKAFNELDHENSEICGFFITLLSSNWSRELAQGLPAQQDENIHPILVAAVLFIYTRRGKNSRHAHEALHELQGRFEKQGQEFSDMEDELKKMKTELAVAEAKIAKLEKDIKMFGSQKRAREDDDAENPRTNIKRP